MISKLISQDPIRDMRYTLAGAAAAVRKAGAVEFEPWLKKGLTVLTVRGSTRAVPGRSWVCQGESVRN